jgi:hypothetical protein
MCWQIYLDRHDDDSPQTATFEQLIDSWKTVRRAAALASASASR